MSRSYKKHPGWRHSTSGHLKVAKRFSARSVRRAPLDAPLEGMLYKRHGMPAYGGLWVVKEWARCRYTFSSPHHMRYQLEVLEPMIWDHTYGSGYLRFLLERQDRANRKAAKQLFVKYVCK